VFLVAGITSLTMDKFLYNPASPVARSTLNVFLLWTLKGLGSYFVVNLFARRVSETKILDLPAEYQVGLPCGVLLCIPLPFSDCHRNVQFETASKAKRYTGNDVLMGRFIIRGGLWGYIGSSSRRRTALSTSSATPDLKCGWTFIVLHSISPPGH